MGYQEEEKEKEAISALDTGQIKALLAEGNTWAEVAAALGTTKHNAIMALAVERAATKRGSKAINLERVSSVVKLTEPEDMTQALSQDDAANSLELSKGVVSGLHRRFVMQPLAPEARKIKTRNPTPQIIPSGSKPWYITKEPPHEPVLTREGHEAIWRAFSEGMGEPSLLDAPTTARSRIRAILNQERITPPRVQILLKIPPEKVIEIINGSYTDVENARKLGEIVRDMRRAQAAALENTTPSFEECMAIICKAWGYKPGNFPGMDVPQALGKILAEKGMTLEEAAQSAGISHDDLGKLRAMIERAGRMDASARVLARRLATAMREQATPAQAR